MKKNLLNLVLAAIACAFTGCAPVSVAMRDVAAPPSIKRGDLIELAIMAAREVGFPPATKIDKENGLVEFGAFGTPTLGITAQVRVKSPTEVEVTVSRQSVYIALGVDKQADEFVAKLKGQLGDTAVKVVK